MEIKNIVNLKDYPIDQTGSKEYQDLIDSYEWNKLIYNSSFSFKPEKGEIYHLYQRKDEKLFLSIIGPDEWNMVYIGSFRLDSNDKWEKIDLES